jgi:uncharacterized membrane protein YqaE (UPF0057 family)
MKKTAFTLSAFFIAVLFFASCSSENLVIQKRHYGKGYYVHANGKREINNTVKAETVALSESPVSTTENPETFIAQETSTNKSQTVSAKAPAITKHNTKIKSSSPLTTVADQKASIEKSASAKNKASVRAAAKKENHSAGGDVNAVLLIILCILLPPVAVYLVDGIGTSFWIDLILTLLFFLPGIIFALIVCL